MDSKDIRTRRQKLLDMANQQTSPNEAEIAKKKLEELGPESDTHISAQYFEIKFTVTMTQTGFDFFSAWNNISTASGFGEY